MDDTATLERPTSPAVAKPAVPVMVPSALNRIDMDIKGDQVHLNALLDHKGLHALEKKIQAPKLLLEVHYDAMDTGEDENHWDDRLKRIAKAKPAPEKPD